MVGSGNLAFPACPSASWIQVPNGSARCTRLEGGVCGGLLILAGPVPEPHGWCSGLGGGTLEDCWKLDGKLNTCYIACTSNFMYVTLNVSQIEYRPSIKGTKLFFIVIKAIIIIIRHIEYKSH